LLAGDEKIAAGVAPDGCGSSSGTNSWNCSVTCADQPQHQETVTAPDADTACNEALSKAGWRHARGTCSRRLSTPAVAVELGPAAPHRIAPRFRSRRRGLQRPPHLLPGAILSLESIS